MATTSPVGRQFGGVPRSGAASIPGTTRLGRLVKGSQRLGGSWVDGQSSAGVTPTTTLGRNTFGEVTDERDPTGAVTRTGYDAMGREKSVTLPPYLTPGGVSLSPTMWTDRDSQGRPITETGPLGRVTRYEYDRYGRMDARIEADPDGDDGPKTSPRWGFRYDRVGQLLETTDPTGARVLATYDDLGHQVTESIAEHIDGQTLYYTSAIGRNQRGQVTSLRTPRGGTSSREYNKAGQPTKLTGADGETTEYRYDGVGRKTAPQSPLPDAALPLGRRIDLPGGG
ncbi:hypothetical protein ACQP08_09505 [Micromonospora zamorensis]|uniref:hypothetical protein n=1 Tax=Micromonospora zamorensis TaxID=709883 RepID=UPI003D8C5569